MSPWVFFLNVVILSSSAPSDNLTRLNAQSAFSAIDFLDVNSTSLCPIASLTVVHWVFFGIRNGCDAMQTSDVESQQASHLQVRHHCSPFAFATQ